MARKYFNINGFIKIMILSDFTMFSAFGLIAPIFAIFSAETLAGGSIFKAALGSTVFLLVKSFLQIPISKAIDKNHGEIDDYWTAVIGTYIIALVPFLYFFISSITQLYIVQILYGIGGALAFPGWISMYTRHLDRGHESFEWSIYNTTISVATAITAAIGGYLIQLYGFRIIFLLVGSFGVLGATILLLNKNKISRRPHPPKVARVDIDSTHHLRQGKRVK